MASQSLQLFVQFASAPRLIKTVGADGSFDTLMLAGTDLKDNTDIRMEAGSALPTSKAARQAFLMDLMTRGFISPQDGLQLLDMGGMQKLYERMALDQSQARRENIKLKKMDQNIAAQFQAQQQQLLQVHAQAVAGPAGMPPQQPPQAESILPVNTWDNHATHVQVHNDFRKSQEFELLPDPVKNEFEAHVQMHLAAISQGMMQAQQFGPPGGIPAQASGGQPGPTPMPPSQTSPGG
jgi:hypothetical protein